MAKSQYVETRHTSRCSCGTTITVNILAGYNIPLHRSMKPDRPVCEYSFKPLYNVVFDVGHSKFWRKAKFRYTGGGDSTFPSFS